MDVTQFSLAAFAASVAAGILGSLLGLGGGVIVVPVLTLVFGIDIHYAVGASIVSVIATSSGATTTVLKQGIANLRAGMLLEMATSTGAVLGAMAAAFVSSSFLYLIFGLMLAYSAIAMFRRRNADAHPNGASDNWASRLRLAGEYLDSASGKVV